MTVKCLTQDEKDSVVISILTGFHTTKSAADEFKVSTRTIRRVMEQEMINLTKPDRPPVPVVIPTKTPWYKKIFKMSTYLNNQSQH